MLKVRIGDIDELNRLTAEITALNYLQGLVHYDKIEGGFFKKEIQTNWEFVFHYIFDLQSETVNKLNALVQKENFIVSVDA